MPPETRRKPSAEALLMARPPLPLGQHGEISIAPKRGQWVARCRLRGFDGVTRKLERAGRTRTAARREYFDLCVADDDPQRAPASHRRHLVELPNDEGGHHQAARPR